MKWSRTETLNMLGFHSIDDAMAQSVLGRGGEPREHGRQVVEWAFAGHQRIELRVREQAQDELHAPRITPPRTLGRSDRADLRRLQRQTAAVERGAERHRGRGIAVPAQLENGRLE